MLSVLLSVAINRQFKSGISKGSLARNKWCKCTLSSWMLGYKWRFVDVAPSRAHGAMSYLKVFAGPGHSTARGSCAAVPSRHWHYQICLIDGKYISTPICTFFSIFSALVFGHVVGDRLSLFFFLFFSKYDTWDQLVCHIRFLYNWCSRQVRGLEPYYPDWDLPVRMVLTFFSMIDDVPIIGVVPVWLREPYIRYGEWKCMYMSIFVFS